VLYILRCSFEGSAAHIVVDQQASNVEQVIPGVDCGCRA